MRNTSPNKFSLSIISIILLIGFAHTTDITEDAATSISIDTVNNPYSFRVDLEDTAYMRPFFFTVTSTALGPRPSCTGVSSTFAYPQGANTYTVPSSFIDTTNHYNQIETYQNFRFISKGNVFQIYWINSDYSQSKTFSATTPTPRTFMAIDTATNYIYLLDNSHIYSYNLVTFAADVSAAVPPAAPTFSFSPADATGGSAFGQTGSLLVAVKIYNSNLFMVFQDSVYIYKLTSTGTIDYSTPSLAPKIYNSGNIGAFSNLKDIGFRGNNAFILDQDNGIFGTDITTHTAVAALTFTRKGGEFLEVTSTTLLIMTSTTSIIYEYFIYDDPTTGPNIEFNQHILSTYGNLQILDTYADDTYLYLTTDGAYPSPLIIRHSIPTRFTYVNRQDQEVSLAAYTGYFAIKAIDLGADGSTTAVMLKSDGTVQELDLTVLPPYLWCTVSYTPGCIFWLNIEAAQRGCSTRPPTSTDPRDVCLIEQDLTITVYNSPYACYITANITPSTALASFSGPRIQIKPRSVNISKTASPESNNTKNETEVVPVKPSPPPRTKPQPPRVKPENPISKTKEHRHGTLDYSQAQTHKESILQNKETGFTLVESEKTHEEIVMEMNSENNSLMSLLVLGGFGSLVLLVGFASFFIWWCSQGKQGEKTEEEDNENFGDEKSFVTYPEDPFKETKENKETTENNVTLGDESRVYFPNEVTQLDINDKSLYN